MCSFHRTTQAIYHQRWTRPRESVCNQKVLTKPSAIQKIHCHRRVSKKQIVTAVQPVLLYPLVEQLTGFGQVSALYMLQHLFTSYRAIDEIVLEEKRGKNDEA